ncbi:peptide ABC transporter ATP-binding protein [Frondihabitans sp. PAMC 28766]|uniref:ABC transporter ATP-binding protein n=1 Tax=Frondihabitans sp. PAMC 28766 TaxID=1795630 RepID=UPI00078B8951|nr:ATP-binding cassette domain-containing protein [Frondihabitans sp. PAMC 28766]AMM21914.1 peptide ABC transporter ATP-binding protein [Frondihabitans sp. PAMC 28766]
MSTPAVTPVTTPGVRIEATGVRKSYGRKTAVQDVSFVLGQGERVGIVGESGSGKSTMAKIITGLEKASAGSITVDGHELNSLLSTRAGRLEYRRKVQLVAQDTTSTFDPRHRIRESLRVPAQLLGGHDQAGADQAISEITAELGILPDLVDRFPGELSGGQRQRMSIARALIVRPGLLVCDEAVSALDVSVQGVVLNLLKRYSIDHGAGLMFVSHGLPATAFITRELVVMNAGRVVETGRTLEILERPQHAYTQKLVSAYEAVEEPAA